MGCVSSNLLNRDDEFTQLSLSHHIVSLTSTTYGLLTLDHPPPEQQTPLIPPTRFTFGSIFPSPLLEPKSETKIPRSEPEVINSWELMYGLENESFRFSPSIKYDKENSNPNFKSRRRLGSSIFKKSAVDLVDKNERLCPPNGENKVVIYTTTLRGIRSTFEACNSVRSVFEGFGVMICERDVSMDRGFRDEIRVLMKGKGKEEAMILPRVFVKGMYLGGAEEVLKIVEQGLMGKLLEGVQRKCGVGVCEGCGDARFLPCFSCNGSCKNVMEVMKEEDGRKPSTTVVVQCSDCNENGLMLCPICS